MDLPSETQRLYVKYTNALFYQEDFAALIILNDMVEVKITETQAIPVLDKEEM